MNKQVLPLFSLLTLVIVISLISAADYSYLKQYYDSLDNICKTDSDCVIKNVENCCGYHPMCLDKDAALDPLAIASICKNDTADNCKDTVISYCRCHKIGSKKRCVGQTGRVNLECGDGNCFKEEANISNQNYCEKDCVASTDRRTECEKNNGYCEFWSVDCKEGYTDSNDFGLDSCKGLKTEKCCIIGKNETEPQCPELMIPNCPEGSLIKSQGNDDNGCPKSGKCIKNLSNGEESEIKIMPETASERAKERLGELGFTIVLKEITNHPGKYTETKAVYELEGEKEGKFLGLFKAKGKVKVLVDADTGEVLTIKKPWWLSFSK